MNENNDKMIKQQKSSSDDAQEKEAAADDDDAENVCGSFSIPLPIQTFLWRQTSPFIRPRSKLQDAAAMEQREACKLFEKVLVQNIRFGLSPSLTKAIASISRWRLIVAALPHVMHCCSALLYARRKSSFDKLSASETKLLYTLHWILLDAAEECADEENERGIHRPPEHYLLPVTTIQTFCYLFAPLIPHLKQSDFLASFRLENGYKIWIPLFNYCHPEIPSFIAHAKQNTFSLSRTDRRIAIPKFGDVFIGSGPSTTDAPTTSTTTTTTTATIAATAATAGTSNDNAITKSVISASAAAAAAATKTNLVERKDSYDIFGEPTTTSSYATNNNDEQSTKGDLKKKYEFIKKDLAEPSLATYLDVAVLRCLFTSQWIEDGIDWALNFLYHRLECIQKNQEKRHRYRFRSNSLPAAPFRRGGGVYSEPKTTTPTPPPALLPASAVYSSHSHIQTESKPSINRPNDNYNNNNTVPDGSSPLSSYHTSQIIHQPYSSNDHHSNHNNNNSNKTDRHDVKLKTFQDVRRSSFSGLPGLSGFQALISSTSSASFGRHGSEKVKHHKKTKKQQQQQQQQRSTPNDSQNDAGKSSNTNNPNNNKFHHRSLSSTSKAKHSLHLLSNKNDSATRSANKLGGKSNKHKDHKDKDHHQMIDENCQQAAASDSRPSSVNSMKNRFETRLVDRDDFKSMPELHLIDDGQQQALPIKEKFPSINLIPEVVRSPSHSSLIEYSTTTGQQQQQQQQQQQTNSVPFPIITITEHSPVQSMHFFNNNNNNHNNSSSDPMKRSNHDPTTDLGMVVPGSKYKFYIEDDDSVAVDQHHQHPVDHRRQQQLKRHQHQHQHYRDQQQEFEQQQLQQPSSAWKMMLFRSKSDSHINYTIETSGESLASMNYVNKNGQLSLVVILKAIHSITLRDSVCSMRVCKMIYKIINKLMSFKLISKRIGDIYNAKKFKTFKPNYDNPELSVHHLFMDTLFRIVKQLGCSKGCGEGRREIEAVRLKENVMKALKQLHEMSEMQFLQYCEMLVTSHPIQEVLDIFHAFFAFCSEVPPAPVTISSQQHLTTTAFPFKKSTFGQASTGSHGPLAYKNGYYNNFGAGFATGTTTTTSATAAATASSSSKIALVKQEVGCIIVKCTFKPFISRLVFVQKELKVQDNMSLYCEIRQFIAYARDHHGGIFRNAALSGLIESTKFVLNSDKILPSKMMMALKDDTTDQPQYQPQPQPQATNNNNNNNNNFTRSTIPEETTTTTTTNDKLIKRKKFNVLPVVASTNYYRSKSLMDSSQGIIVPASATITDIQQSSQSQSSSQPPPPEWLPDLSGPSNRNLQFGATTSQTTINNHHHHLTNNSNSQMDLDQTKFINVVDQTTFKLAKQYSQQQPTTPQRPDNDSMMMISYDGGINAQQQSPMPADSALQNYPGIGSFVDQQQQQQSMMASDNKLIRRGSFNRQTLKGYIGNNSSTPQQQQQANYVLSMNPKSTTFFKARKRMDQFKNVFGKNRIKQNSFDETPDMSRKNSLDFERLQQQEMIMIPEMPLKKSKQIFMEILKDGMLKFQFLLESCTPGTIPDAQLIAAMLDLKAPVVARAAFLLECCRFVHRCNRGQWPAWMRINFNFFRQSGPVGRSGSQSVMKSRASTTLQKLAGRCFYQWAELLSSRLEDILQTEIELKQIATSDEQQQQQQQLLQQQLDDDDFYSVPTTDTKEGSCPFALRIVACQLLYEITTYLRETHQYLLSQSSRRTSVVATAAAAQQPERRTFCPAEPPQMPSTSLMKHPVNTNRRWSMALSTTGPVHLLDHCMVQPSERRISFVLHEAEGENDSGSLIGSSEDIAYPQDRKRLSQVGPAGLTSWAAGRSGSGHESFRRRSIKLKKNDSSHKKGHNQKLRSATLVEDDYKSMFKRSNSLRSKRKVSIASEKSDTSDKYSGEESPGFQTEESHPGFQNILNNTTDTNDSEMIENLPWLKITTLFANALNFECSHQTCANNCHKRIIRSTAKLTKEVQRLYDKDIQPMGDFDQMSQRLVEDREDLTKKEKKLKKILMGHYQSSPLKRKASALNMERNLERDSHSQSVYNSSMGLAHTNIDLEFGMYDSEDPRLIFHDVLNYRLESKQEENVTMLYILNQVKNPFHSIISMMLKSALILNRNQFEYLIKISWNLILDDDIQISSSACVSIIVCSLKCPDLVVNLLNNDLNHQNVDIRVNAIKKFSKIWGNRHQCWQRLEEGAHLVLKLPPAAIEFTLPSPRIALECKPVVDPPYMPIAKTKVDEVAINQEPSIQKSFVAATKTRRKQQIELVSKALQDQEDKLREERENYRFTSVPVTLQAAYEPVLYHTIDDHDDNEDDVERIPLHHLQVAQCFFPSSLTTASFLIVNLLEDTQINSEGVAVFDVAYKVIWHCLCDDPALFLRNLLEKLTREKKNVVIQTIRRLIRFVPRLPAQAAFTLYNYLIGFIMYHVRTPTENSQEIIASVMSILWLIVPNVFGLFLKDLKQILRKEQCDATILITANVPSAKKIIVHGPELGSIPTQFPVHEDTQFSQILTDSLDFFGIDESKHNEYFLVDTKTNQIHNLNAFVRDFYFFKRSQYPQLSLVHMNPIEAYDKFQRQAFTLQFTELGKCLMTLSLIKTSFLGIQRVLFLHEDLMKLPSFPRKALETNLTLYTGPMGREVLGIDTLHKISWVKLVARMFEATSGFFADASDIHLFLNVINGTLLLHCEDATILRLCMATYINAAHQFKNIFATNGYLLIVQTIVQIYATHQTNSLLCRTIEFVFKQFYILHSKPFVLQMFGAVAPLLDTDTTAKYETNCQVHPKAFFQLLQSLGQYTADPLDILELVDAEKPLKALDFCYQMDPETLTVLDSISLCVTVISYAPDSERGHQMLTVLDSILPFHLMHMQTLTTKKETPGGPRAELTMIHNISVCIKTLIYNCEALTRNFTGPQKALDVREASIKNQSPFIEIDEDSHSKFNPDSYYPPRHNRIELDDGELSRMEFRKPRDLLLKIVSEFLTKSTSRFAELSKKISEIHQKNSSYELLDVKCHIRLAEIAHSLLKLAPYDPPTMACKGLVRYMNEILPNSEWRQESMRPALIMVLRRLDKTFAKISKKTAIKRTTDWEAARRLLKGVYLTFVKHPYIVHLPHLKSLINVCQNIILGDQTSYLSDSSSSAVSSWTMALSQAPPPGFISVAVRLISLQMIQLGDSQSLETICSGAFSSPEKSEIYLMNMIYPMCIRTTSGMKDTPKFRQCDINFVLNVILNILKPINSKPTKGSDSSQAGVQLKQFSLQQIGFLGLKILITCFEKQLTTEWYHIAKCIKDLADKPHLIGSTFWNFIDFVCTYRTPLFVLMLPYIKCKYLQKTCESEIEQIYQSRTQEKLNGGNMPYNRSKGYLYVQLVNEMKSLREDIIKRKFNPNIDERSKSIAQEQNSASDNKPENSGHRLSFAFSQLAASASKQSNISSTVQNTSSSSFAQQQQQQQQQQQSSHGNAGGDPSTSTSSQPSAPLSSIRPRVLRGLSFRLSSDSRRLASRGLSVKLASNQSDKRMFVRRTSYPDHPDIDKNVVALKPPGESTGSESKLFRQLAITTSSSTSSSVKNSSKPKGSISFSGETLAENKENKMHKETSFTIPSTTGTTGTTISNNNQKDQQQQQSRYLQRQQQQKNHQQNKRSFRFKKGSNSSEEQSSSSKSQSIAESEFENTTNTSTTHTTTSTTTTTINTTARISTPTKVLAGNKSSLVPLCDNNENKADSDNKNNETTKSTTTTTTTNLNPYSTINDCDKLTTTTINNHSPNNNNNKSGGNNNNNNNNIDDDDKFENNGNHDDGHRPPPPSFEMNNNSATAAANMLTSAARAALDTASSTTATTNIESSINVLPYADEQT